LDLFGVPDDLMDIHPVRYHLDITGMPTEYLRISSDVRTNRSVGAAALGRTLASEFSAGFEHLGQPL